MTTIQPLLHHMEAAAPPSQPTQHTHYSGTVQVPTGAYDIIFQCAGGYSSNENKNILDIKFPDDIHSRTSVMLFSKKEYEQFCTF